MLSRNIINLIVIISLSGVFVQKTQGFPEIPNGVKNIGLLTAGAVAATAVTWGIKYIDAKRALAQKKVTKIGCLHINEFIADATKYAEKLYNFSNDSTIQAIYIIINSHGGFTGSSFALHEEIKKIKVKKPVVAFAENDCLSGAYLVAAAASKVVAAPASAIGSIGTYRKIEKYHDLEFKNNGYLGKAAIDYVYAGKDKVFLFRDAPELSEEQRKIVQDSVNNSYNLFCQKVAETRNIPLDQSSNWAEGKCHDSSVALEYKLIDEVGCYSDALDKVKELLKARGSEVGEIVLVK